MISSKKETCLSGSLRLKTVNFAFPAKLLGTTLDEYENILTTSNFSISVLWFPILLNLSLSFSKPAFRPE